MTECVRRGEYENKVESEAKENTIPTITTMNTVTSIDRVKRCGVHIRNDKSTRCQQRDGDWKDFPHERQKQHKSTKRNSREGKDNNEHHSETYR